MIPYCNNCKSYYCDIINKTNEYIEPFFDTDDKNSLLVNPDLDLEDRDFSDSEQLQMSQDDNDRYYSDLNMLFHGTLTSIKENFNEEICKLKVKKSKENDINFSNDKNGKNVNENKILIKEFDYDKEKLEKLPPLKRMEKILDILNI